METQIIGINELKEGDIFSFRTIKTPIWWRFISVIPGEIHYEEIKSKFRHTSYFAIQTTYPLVKKRIKTSYITNKT